MTDLTGPLSELRGAYRAYQNAKRDKKEEIQEKYRTRMESEIRAAVEAEKYQFARLLADRKDFYGLRVTDIQDHVLRTRNWKVWEDIRDYAEIEPEMITRSNTKEQERIANAFYRWEEADTDFGYVLVLMKDEQGNRIEPEAVITDLKVTVQNKLSAMPTVFGEDSHRSVWEKHWNGSGPDMQKYATRVANEHRGEIGK